VARSWYRRRGGYWSSRSSATWVSMNQPNPDQGALFRALRGAVTRASLTARRAAVVITLATTILTVIGGVAAWIVDDSFSSLGLGLWWSVQTLTTVGYGDVVPQSTAGRLIATVVMLNGIAFLTVITAAVTALLVEQMRGRRERTDTALGRPDVARTLEDIRSRLDAIEASLAESQRDRGR
jgi:voltage-gated potassium channel